MTTKNPRRKLLQDISVQELYRMRDEGMSNQEIADAIGVTRNTIYRHIGKQDPKKKGKDQKPMTTNKMTQTEKFMSRLEKSDITHRKPQEAACEAAEETAAATPAVQENSAREATRANPAEFDRSGENRSRLPRPVRVLKEYEICDGVRIISDNGRFTITGAEDLSGEDVRLLCRTLMLIRDEEA